MKYFMVFVLALASLSAHAGLTKWVDSDGVVHYTDGPPPADVKSQSIGTSQTAPSSSASAPAGPKTIYEQESEMRKSQKAREEADQKAAKAQEEARAKQQNCARAQDQLRTLQNSPRIATYDESGNRSYMDDSARQQQISDAQAAVSQYCN